MTFGVTGRHSREMEEKSKNQALSTLALNLRFLLHLYEEELQKSPAGSATLPLLASLALAFACCQHP